jgi:hypothetical protein
MLPISAPVPAVRGIYWCDSHGAINTVVPPDTWTVDPLLDVGEMYPFHDTVCTAAFWLAVQIGRTQHASDSLDPRFLAAEIDPRLDDPGNGRKRLLHPAGAGRAGHPGNRKLARLFGYRVADAFNSLGDGAGRDARRVIPDVGPFGDRLTAACTPARALSAFSSRPAHVAQVMPSMGRTRCMPSATASTALAGFTPTSSADNLCAESGRFRRGDKLLRPERTFDERAGVCQVDLRRGHTRHSRQDASHGETQPEQVMPSIDKTVRFASA